MAHLSFHRHFVPVLVDAFTREWPDWAAKTPRAELESIFEEGADGALPIVLVAIEGEDPVGTVALRPYFAEEPIPQTPWVRQLLVLPQKRGRGIDRLLLAELERYARERGYRHLYAATSSIERLLVHRGWKVFRSVEHEGEAMAWLTKPINGV